MTNENVFDLKQRPKRLGIIGAGAIGCELAQAFARLGVEVVLLEHASRVLVNEDPRASEALAAALREDGVTVRLGASVSMAARRGSHVSLTVDGEKIVVDEVLVAAGRRPNADELNLAAVGVEVESDGRITVDRFLRTTNPRIYAAGDVCSQAQLTHNADAQARIVVQNALFAPTATTDRLVIPRCTYTEPEVAQIGPTAATLERDGAKFDRYCIEFRDLDRGRIQDDEGFVEIFTAAGRDRILGATLVGRDAGEQIASVAIAMALGLGLAELGKAVLPYPTRAEFIRKAADAYRRSTLTPRKARLLRAWLRWRR